MRRAPVDAAPPGGRLVAEDDVLGHGAERDEVQLLVDRGDAAGLRLAGACERDSAAVEGDRPLVARVDAGEDLDERRLSGAVLADEAVHLAAADDQLGA